MKILLENIVQILNIMIINNNIINLFYKILRLIRFNISNFFISGNIFYEYLYNKNIFNLIHLTINRKICILNLKNK